MTHCPRCRGKLDRAASLIAAHVVLGCRGPGRCNRFAVEIPGMAMEWVEGGPGWLDRLKASVAGGEAVRAIVESESDDPRWLTMEML